MLAHTDTQRAQTEAQVKEKCITATILYSLLRFVTEFGTKLNKKNKVKTFTVILAQTKQPEVTLAVCETYPFPHKSACCQSFIPARQVCSSDFFRLKMEAETLQTPFLCSEFLLLAGPVLLLSY